MSLFLQYRHFSIPLFHNIFHVLCLISVHFISFSKTISSAFDLRISLFETADKLSYPTTVKTIRNTTLIPLLVHTVDICESITLRKCLFVCLENRYSTVSVLSLADGPNPKMAPFCKSQPAANFGSAMHKFFSISF